MNVVVKLKIYFCSLILARYKRDNRSKVEHLLIQGSNKDIGGSQSRRQNSRLRGAKRLSGGAKG